MMALFNSKKPGKLTVKGNNLMMYGKPFIPIGASDPQVLAIWENDLGFHWTQYIKSLQSASANFSTLWIDVHHQSFRQYPEQFSNQRWPFVRLPSNIFDLHVFDDVYFQRLRQFLDSAYNAGKVTQAIVFNCWGAADTWADNYWNPVNNRQKYPASEPQDAFIRNYKGIRVQLALLQKVIDTIHRSKARNSTLLSISASRS